MLKYQNLDSDTQFYFERELEAVKAKSFDVVYPDLKARELFPLDSTTAPGAQTVSYQSFDMVGVAKLLSNYADDLPNVEVTGTETTRQIYGIGVAFMYSIQDIRASQMAGRPLEQRKANAAQRQLLRKENALAFNGDARTSIPPFINNPNFTATTPTDGAVGGLTTWESKSPDEILTDVTNMTIAIRDTTFGTEAPNTLILPEKQFALISTTARSSTSDTTILDFILASNAFVTSILPVYNLKGAAPVNAAYDSEDCAILYDRNPDKLWLETPVSPEFFAAQERQLMFEVPGHMRTAGVICPYPKSVTQLNGI